MTFHEKLDRLLLDRNKRAVARRAGISEMTLINQTKRRMAPTVRVATRLANALGVDLGWLIDDTRGWPPVHVYKDEETQHGATPAPAAA